MAKVLFIFFFLVGYFLTAQTFTVGSTCCNYHLVNKTFISVAQGPFVLGNTDTLPIDIDGDLISDLVIKSRTRYAGSSQGTNERSIFATSASGVESVITYSTASWTFIINNLNYGAVFNPSLSWDTLPITVNIGGQYSPIISYSVPVIYEQWSKPITGGYYVGGQETNPFYFVFRKILPSNDTIFGWVKMDSHFPGKVIDYAHTCGTFTGTAQSSTIITSPSIVQKCDSVQLNGTPAGGVFYGPGVSGNYFKTKNLMQGSYSVSYDLHGCSIQPSAVTFTVVSPAAFTNAQTTLCKGDSLLLTAIPPGGVFSGYPVYGNMFFSPFPGNYTANYSYTNSPGCIFNASVALHVNDCVGIKENGYINPNFSIYPNPANDKLNVVIDDFKNANKYLLKLISLDGKILKQQALNHSNNEMDISSYDNGIYFVEIVLDKAVFRKKLVVNR